MIFKKKAPLATLLFSSALVLAACGDETEVEEPVSEEAPQEANETNPPDEARTGGGITEENIGGGTFGFTDFDLDVDYPDQDDAVNISYEETRDQVDAEYENKLTDTDVEGNDAMDEIEPAFSGLELNSDTPDDEVISKVIEAFSLEDGFESFELEITYQDGTEKEYKQSGN